MNYGHPAQHQMQPGTPSPECFQRLGKTIESLQESVVALIGRLDPILTPIGPERVGEGLNAVHASSPLSSQIDRLVMVERMILSLSQRIEL